MMQIEDRAVEEKILPILRLAFRPLFLFGVAFAAISLLRWVLVLNGSLSWSGAFNSLVWHSHEMIFGFTLAIIVGFLLTAVQTWTGIPGFKGWPLALMTLFWLSGRAVFWAVSDAPLLIYLLPDLLFILTATVVLARPIFAVKQQRNMLFVPILALFALLHLLQTGFAFYGKLVEAQQVIRAATWLVVLLISVIAGRVIPFFTSRRWDTEKPQESRLQMLLANGALVVIALLYAVGLDGSLVAKLIYGAAALVHAVRVYQWWNHKNLREPLLWSLHIGYAMLPATLLLLALADKGTLLGIQSFHLLAIGCIGGVILAMVARVSLGHTGRALTAHRLMSVAFSLMFLSMLVRVFMPLLQPVWMVQSYMLSGGLFIAALGLFCLLYFPVLTQPRVDGRSG